MNSDHTVSFEDIVDSADAAIYDIRTQAPGPEGRLPLEEEQVLNSPSGDIFGYSMNAGMGWKPSELGGKEFLSVSTRGGMRAEDGAPVALG